MPELSFPDRYVCGEINKKDSKTGLGKMKSKCIMCGNQASDKSKSGLCRKCYDVKRRKVERPDQETLLDLVNEMGYSATGRKLGVSDNAVRKWLKLK